MSLSINYSILEAKKIYKSEKHHGFVSKQQLAFYKRNEFIDTILVVGSECVKIKAHRLVLCSLSEFFLEFFRKIQEQNQIFDKNNNNKNSTLEVIELEEFNPSTFKQVIDFLYTGEIELSRSRIGMLFQIAVDLKIQMLIDCCVDFLEDENIICSDNALRWFRFAYKLGLRSVMEKSKECIYTNFVHVYNDEEVLQLPIDEFKELLFENNPYDDFEELIFETMVAWMNYDITYRKKHIFELLSQIRYHALTPNFILNNTKTICKSVESYELMFSWLEWHLSPVKQKKIHLRLKNIKKPDRLAVCGILEDNQISIKTFDHQNKLWSPHDLKMNFLELKNPRDSLMIVIDGKLFVVEHQILNVNSINLQLKFLDLITNEWATCLRLRWCEKPISWAHSNRLLFVFARYLKKYKVMFYNITKNEWKIYKETFTTSDIRLAIHRNRLYILDFENSRLHLYSSLHHVKIATFHMFNQSFDIESTSRLLATDRYLYLIGGKCFGRNKVMRFDMFERVWCAYDTIESPWTRFETIFQDSKYNRIIIFDGTQVKEYKIPSSKWQILGSTLEFNMDGPFTVTMLNI